MAKSYLEHMLGEQEKVILSTRQHWFMLFRAIFIELVLFVVIILITVAVAVFFNRFPWYLIALVGFILILIPLMIMIRDLMDWSNRQFVVTNRRVIQISGVINKNVTDSSLEKVNDVKLEQSFLGRIFNYGDVEILTASELGVNLFRHIAQPIKFKTSMINAKEILENGPALSAGVSGEPHPANIPGMIDQLDQLRQRGILTEEEFQLKKELLSKM